MSTLKAIIQTSKGDININLFDDKTPVTVANFVLLATSKYYDNLIFHRVIQDFMIQGGCPDGTGMGGPGYQFNDECRDDLRHDAPGKLSMANSGPGTNGSQFFVTHVETPWLDGKHTVFGEVDSSMDQDVVNAVAQGDQIFSISIEGDTSKLMEENKEAVDEFRVGLSETFPDLVSA